MWQVQEIIRLFNDPSCAVKGSAGLIDPDLSNRLRNVKFLGTRSAAIRNKKTFSSCSPAVGYD